MAFHDCDVEEADILEVQSVSDMFSAFKTPAADAVKLIGGDDIAVFSPQLGLMVVPSQYDLEEPATTSQTVILSLADAECTWPDPPEYISDIVFECRWPSGANLVTEFQTFSDENATPSPSLEHYRERFSEGGICTVFSECDEAYLLDLKGKRDASRVDNQDRIPIARKHPAADTASPASWRASPPSRESAPARSPTRARRPAAPRGQLVRANRTGRPTGAGPRSRDGASRSGTCVHTAAPRPYHQGNIHIAAAFPRRIPLRSCAMEHIVLEYDENTRTALVVATSGGHEPVLSGHASPYIVADGYDFESRSWGAGHYFTDIAQAKIDYERSCRHPYPLAEGKLRGDEFCTIRWCRDDVAEAFSDFLSYPVPATEKNIDAAIGQLMAHDGFQDRSIEDGWETISAIIDEDALDLGISTKQGADFYRDAFGLSSFTEAVVWPSSDRDAAFVMTSAVDGEDGDLAVYKIDAGLIGDDEITVDDIERLGGKRELCVYKHGLDGIEAIRAFANRVAVDRFDERFGVNNLYGELPDLAPTLRKVTEDARTAAQKPLDPQAIAAAALSAAEGGAKGAVELVGNKR